MTKDRPAAPGETIPVATPEPTSGTPSLPACWWPALAADVPVVFGAEEAWRWLARRFQEKRA